MFRGEVLGSRAAIAAHIDARALERLAADHERGKIDASYPLWAAWVLERWLTDMGSKSLPSGSLPGSPPHPTPKIPGWAGPSFA
jgi:hypothetical protein